MHSKITSEYYKIANKTLKCINQPKNKNLGVKIMFEILLYFKFVNNIWYEKTTKKSVTEETIVAYLCTKF